MNYITDPATPKTYYLLTNKNEVLLIGKYLKRSIVDFYENRAYTHLIEIREISLNELLEEVKKPLNEIFKIPKCRIVLMNLNRPESNQTRTSHSHSFYSLN